MIEPARLSQWIAAHGPYLYHCPRDFYLCPRILQEGLVPASQLAEGPASGGAYTPRPDHVYMGTLSALSNHVHTFAYEMIRIDLRLLDPAALVPDEDVFWAETYGEPLSPAEWGLSDPVDTVADADTYCWLADSTMAQARAAVAERPYASYGAWAQAHAATLDAPQLTQLSLTRFGVLAHRGIVPAAALALVMDCDHSGEAPDYRPVSFAEAEAAHMACALA